MSLKEQNDIIANEIATFNARKSLLAAAIIIVATFILKIFLPDDPAQFGVLCTIPALLMILYIFITKRIIEALTIGAVVGFIMVGESGSNTLQAFSDSLLSTMMSEDIAWLIIVCGLMGGIISLIERSGGAYAFGQWAAKRARSEKPALIWTWILGCIIFIDDYLNSMTVGSCMAPLTDKHKTPREMLAYVCDSTAAPLCVLIPITTWSVFCGRILVKNGWQVGDASEIEMFVKTMGWESDAQLAKAQKQGIPRQLFPELTPEEQQVVKVLQENNDLQINMLSVQSNVPIGRLTALLFQLEMKGVIRTLAGGMYHLLK